MKVNDFQISKNFNLREFESPDTDEVKLHPELLKKLQKLRDKIGLPLVVGSGYRTPEYNKKIGGAKRSYHLFGMAADVHVQGLSAVDIQRLADEVGFGGIILYPDGNYCHLDIRKGKKLRMIKEE